MIDLRFADLPGLWQHFSVPPRAPDLDEIDEIRLRPHPYGFVLYYDV